MLDRHPAEIAFLLPETADAGLVIPQDPQEINETEIFPVYIGEEELGIDRLPDEEIR